MAQYQVRAKREDTGRYRLEYGKGSNKLSCLIWYNDLAKGWCISEGDGAYDDSVAGPWGTKKSLKSAWGRWAEKVYESGAAESPGHEKSEGQLPDSKPAGPKRQGPPRRDGSRLKSKGPPKRSKRKGPPRREKKPDAEQVQAEAEGINVAHIGQENVNQLAEATLAMLNWAWRNRRDLNQKPWDDAMRVLHRIDPDTYAKYKVETAK